MFPKVALGVGCTRVPKWFDYLDIAGVFDVAGGFLGECTEAMAHKLVSDAARSDEAACKADMLKG